VVSRQFLLLLLLLPGIALGSGWNLRICPQEIFGIEGCCSSESSACCGSNHTDAPSRPGTENARQCDTCCIDIGIPLEQPVRTPDSPAADLNSAQHAALAFSIHAPLPCASGRAPLSQIDPAPDLPGRRTPLPLRL
jgi:hypothetical protein